MHPDDDRVTSASKASSENGAIATTIVVAVIAFLGFVFMINRDRSAEIAQAPHSKSTKVPPTPPEQATAVTPAPASGASN